LSALDDLVRTTARRNDLPGVTVAVVRGDALAAVAAAGVADIDRHTPMTGDGICNWFSMTKIATATAAMILAEAGSLDLDAPVISYLGEVWPGRFASVRVRHLLSHSSGLRNPIPVRWVHRPGEPTPDPDAFLARTLARQRRLRFEPGARAAYTNIGYLAAGQVIASAAGQAYEDFVSEQVLVPLHMTHTTFSWNDPGPGIHRRVVAYQRLPLPFTPIVRAMLPSGLIGPRHGKLVALEAFELDGAAYGGLIGPVEDAARLVALHANHGVAGGTRLLNPDSVAAMSAITTPGRPYDLGLGWFRRHDAANGRVEHLGGGMGYWNVLRLDPKSGMGAAVMSNVTRHWDITALADQAIEMTLEMSP
jgi:CubicO group peptidase (beta-lactamase class C family)